MTIMYQNLKTSIIGLTLALLTLLTLTTFPHQKAIEFTAVLLAIVAAVHIGFAIADGRKSKERVELGTAVPFIIIELAG